MKLINNFSRQIITNRYCDNIMLERVVIITNQCVFHVYWNHGTFMDINITLHDKQNSIFYGTLSMCATQSLSNAMWCRSKIIR